MKITETHFCPKCGEQKPVTEKFFYRTGKGKTGFNLSICKVCQSNYYKFWYSKKATEKIEVENPPEDFDEFCREALNDQTKRATEPIISIYQEIQNE
ncbi:MAG: hypothetical protein MUP81_01680 [Dehalococcoidia bacterium]|nr:hypothetical protein [Dehalococcoidia bacterium]